MLVYLSSYIFINIDKRNKHMPEDIGRNSQNKAKGTYSYISKENYSHLLLPINNSSNHIYEFKSPYKTR